MNTLQKIFIMVTIGSAGNILISILALGYSPIYNDYTDVDDSIERYEKAHGKLGTHKHDYYDHLIWQSEIREIEGVDGFSLALIFKRDGETNWFGLISLFNIIVCTVGIFLFR